MNLTQQAHELLRQHVSLGDIAIDATMGNGHDTTFLAELTGPEGTVYAFDIQEQALTFTRDRVEAEGANNVIMVQSCHSQMTTHLPADVSGSVAAVVFNLGYLPGGEKSVITQAATTTTAISAAYRTLRVGGIISVVAYVGHPGGAEEADAVEDTMQALPGRAWLRQDESEMGSTSPRLLVAQRIC